MEISDFRTALINKKYKPIVQYYYSSSQENITK